MARRDGELPSIAPIPPAELASNERWAHGMASGTPWVGRRGARCSALWRASQLRATWQVRAGRRGHEDRVHHPAGYHHRHPVHQRRRQPRMPRQLQQLRGSW